MKKFAFAAMAVIMVASSAEAFGGRRGKCQTTCCQTKVVVQNSCGACNSHPVASFVGDVVRFPFAVAGRVMHPNCNGSSCPNVAPSVVAPTTAVPVPYVTPNTKAPLPPKVIEAPQHGLHGTSRKPQ